jgi:hypothetical protein
MPTPRSSASAAGTTTARCHRCCSCRLLLFNCVGACARFTAGLPLPCCRTALSAMPPSCTAPTSSPALAGCSTAGCGSRYAIAGECIFTGFLCIAGKQGTNGARSYCCAAGHAGTGTISCASMPRGRADSASGAPQQARVPVHAPN